MSPEYFGRYEEMCTNNLYTKPAYISMVRHALYIPPVDHLFKESETGGELRQLKS